jgi:hypothetical protein
MVGRGWLLAAAPGQIWRSLHNLALGLIQCGVSYLPFFRSSRATTFTISDNSKTASAILRLRAMNAANGLPFVEVFASVNKAARLRSMGSGP